MPGTANRRKPEPEGNGCDAFICTPVVDRSERCASGDSLAFARELLLWCVLIVSRAHAASALIPANDDEDEELINKAKANRQKRIVEEKDTEQDFAKSAGYNGVTLLTIERGVKKLAKSGSELEAGDLSSVAKLVRWVYAAMPPAIDCFVAACSGSLPLHCSDSWVSEFKKAADSVATNTNSKSAVSSAFSSISQLSSSAQQGDANGAKQAFVGAVSSLQSWAAGSGLQVKGL